MIKIAMYDTKPYDKESFKKYSEKYNICIKYIDSNLNADTAALSQGCTAVCAFVNDDINKEVIDRLCSLDIGLIALRCAGYNNVDLKYAKGKIKVARVPQYSPYAVAEHAMGMIMCLNRKYHKAYIRTRDFNFSLNGMAGFDMHGKTVGIVGTGKIGRTFANICKGFGMNVIAFDPYPSDETIEYTDFKTLCKKSDIISLHCPLTSETKHIINSDSIAGMKDGVYIVNTSRGGLIASGTLIDGLKRGKVGAAALDVYEEESEMFFEDLSDMTNRDERLAILLSMPNVLVTSHQAFLTNEALDAIAKITLENILCCAEGKKSENEICFECMAI